jgi:hypothetical protein
MSNVGDHFIDVNDGSNLKSIDILMGGIQRAVECLVKRSFAFLGSNRQDLQENVLS